MGSDSKGTAHPLFKHVQPSGRGTQSEHELAAKRAAVESIERRFDHNERVRKRAARKRAAASFGSVVILLSVLAGVVYYFTHRGEGVSKLGIDLGGLAKAAQEYLPDAVAPSAGKPSSTAETEFRDRYAAVAAEFSQGELALWKAAPDALKPKNAPAGTVYHAMIPNAGKFGLYELKSGGKVVELSPFGPPLSLTMEDFKKACGDKPYFIATAGRVFVCGAGDLKTMDELRKALLPQ